MGNVPKKLIRKSLAVLSGFSSNTALGIFFIVLFLNIRGLTPHIFRVTSHIVRNFSGSSIIWWGLLTMSFFFSYRKSLTHFAPVGTPRYLMPFLILIEMVRALARPFTLAIRLTANLRTGHILITLLGESFNM